MNEMVRVGWVINDCLCVEGLMVEVWVLGSYVVSGWILFPFFWCSVVGLAISVSLSLSSLFALIVSSHLTLSDHDSHITVLFPSRLWHLLTYTQLFLHSYFLTFFSFLFHPGIVRIHIIQYPALSHSPSPSIFFLSEILIRLVVSVSCPTCTKVFCHGWYGTVLLFIE